MSYKVVERPWGHYTILGQWSGRITVRVLTINPNSRISLQKHEYRDEEWLCLSGRARVQLDDRSYILKVGQKIFMPRRHLHRLGSDAGTEILEVAYGEFQDTDIVRVEDDYGRETPIKGRQRSSR